MTSADLIIRPAVAGEEKTIAALWQACDLLRPWNDPEHDIAGCRSNPTSELFVGLAEGSIVASVMVGNDGHRGAVYYMATSPDHRSKGYGRQMLRHGEDWLRRRGVWKINLMIREGNDQVQNFYGGLGYDTEQRTVMARRIGDDETDTKLTSVVTSLQMLHRPSAERPPPPLKNLALLRAEKPTVAFYRYLYDGVGGPWLWYERRLIGDDALRALIEDDKVEIYVLYVDGSPAGYFELDLKKFPQIELAYFGLMAEFIGLKLGPYLLAQAIDTAWAHNPERLWVHTCDLDHPGALPLYQRLDFQPFAQQTETFDDPRLSHPHLDWPSPMRK